MHKISAVLLGILVCAGAILLFQKINQKQPHFHAGFQIYIDDSLLKFDDPKYMSLVPCSDSDVHEIKDAIHLHDGVGDIAHIHHDHVTWQNLFDYLKFSIPNDKPMQAYVNGKIVDDISNVEIHPYDSLVLFIGHPSNIKRFLNDSLTVKNIKDAESKSGLCKG